MPLLQVLTWSSYKEDAFGKNRAGQTHTATLDPVTEKITKYLMTDTNHDMFWCAPALRQAAAHALL